LRSSQARPNIASACSPTPNNPFIAIKTGRCRGFSRKKTAPSQFSLRRARRHNISGASS
jgi:hypothetical protein